MPRRLAPACGIMRQRTRSSRSWRCRKCCKALFATKMHALLCRTYTKGRDWYDFLWFVARRVKRAHVCGAFYKFLILILILILILPSELDPFRFDGMRTNFDHEKLEVYQKAISFVAWADALLEVIPKHLAVHNQLERASTSIPLNIAEGNGKYTPTDRCRFFDIARGSALECAACLDVLTARKQMKLEEADAGKLILIGIVSMLVGLIRSTSPSRVYEESGEYIVNSSEDRD
jgi:four helix bundle protein